MESAEESIKEMIRKHEETRDYFRQLGLEISVKNIEHLRNWTFQVLTISSAILGVVILVGGDNRLIKHSDFLSYAFFCFIFTMILGLYKLKKDIEQDIDDSPKLFSDLCENLTKIIDAEKRYSNERTQEAFHSMEQIRQSQLNQIKAKKIEPKERNYFFDIIFFIFSLGLMLIGFSIRYRFGIFMIFVLLLFLILLFKEEVQYWKETQRTKPTTNK